jgi:hypothetical protein
MPYSRPGADRLHVAGLGAPDVSDAVAVGDNAVANVGDNLHVGVAVQTEARSRSNLVVIPHDQRAKRRVGRIAIGPDRKMVLGLEPAKITAIERGCRADSQHVILRWRSAAPHKSVAGRSFLK